MSIDTIMDSRKVRKLPSEWARKDVNVQLMLRFKEGYESAFEELVERNTNRVHGLLYRFLGGNSGIEDLTQEVFLRVYRNAKRYEPRAKFSTWLYRIVYNVECNVTRARVRNVKRGVVMRSLQGTKDEQTYDRQIAGRGQEPPSQSIELAERSDEIAKAINSLPENQRMAIILKYYEDLTYYDIGGILKVSPEAVKSLLCRARGNLRYSLNKVHWPY